MKVKIIVPASVVSPKPTPAWRSVQRHHPSAFNVRADASARVIDAESIGSALLPVIYDLIDEVKQAMSGMLGSGVRATDHRSG